MSFQAAAIAAVVSAAAISPAYADEDTKVLSATAGFGAFSVPDHRPSGGALLLDYEYGIGRAFAVRASAGGGMYFDEGARAYSGYGSVGLTYAIDVVKYVPYVMAGIGGVYIRGENEDLDVGFQPLIELGAGVDRLLSRKWAVGVTVRFESFLERTALLTAGVRVSRRWSLF